MPRVVCSLLFLALIHLFPVLGWGQQSDFHTFRQAVGRNDLDEAFASLNRQSTATLLAEGWLEYHSLFYLETIRQSPRRPGKEALRGILKAQALLTNEDSLLWNLQAGRTVLYFQTILPDSVLPILSRSISVLGASSPQIFWKQLGHALLEWTPSEPEEWGEWIEIYTSLSWMLMQMTVIDAGAQTEALRLDQDLRGHLAIRSCSCDELIAREASRVRLGFTRASEYKQLFVQLSAKGCTPSAVRDSIRSRVSRSISDPCLLIMVADSYLQEDQFWMAQKLLLRASSQEPDPRYRAAIELRLAGLYAIRRSFRSARLHARQAEELFPEWGQPLIFLADLIESSGAICADSDRERWAITYLAISYLERAVLLNPDLSESVMKRLPLLRAKLPDESQLWVQGVRIGDRIPVSCWINETARVR